MTTPDATTAVNEINALDMALVRGRLDSIGQEMALTIVRTSSSQIVVEANDFSIGLFDPDGVLNSFASYILFHIGSSRAGVHTILRDFPRDEIRPGDMFIGNDPYGGGGVHPQDVALMRPQFFLGELVGWSVTAAHLTDFGGPVAGSFNPGAKETYAEALYLPPVHLMREGHLDRDMWNVIMNNIRVPERIAMDIRGMIAANQVAEARLSELLTDFGVERYRRVTAELVERSEERMRERIKLIPDGEYVAEDWFEGDGSSADIHHVHCRLIVSDDELVFDLNGSDAQVQGFANSPFPTTLGNVYTSVLPVLGFGLPIDEGVLRPVSLVADEGKVVNARKPAATGDGHARTGAAVNNACLGALGKAVVQSESADLRARVSAYWGQDFKASIWAGRNQHGQYDVYLAPDGGSSGAGALLHRDGRSISGMQTQVGGRIADVELMELHNPFLVAFKRFARDSGGAGQRRGGLGMEEAFVLYQVPTQDCALIGQRWRVPLLGAFGGQAGAPGFWGVVPRPSAESDGFPDEAAIHRAVVASDFEQLHLDYTDKHISEGDAFYFITAGGGGIGDPLTRDPEEVAADVRAGFVGEAAADLVYGVLLRDSQVDAEATVRHRQALYTARLTSCNVQPAHELRQAPLDAPIRHPLGTHLECRGVNGQDAAVCAQCGGVVSDDVRYLDDRVAVAEFALGTEASFAIAPRVPALDTGDSLSVRGRFCPGCGVAFAFELTTGSSSEAP
jgi:N-methylhydantoinase B